MPNISKTNVARLLDKAHIPYQIVAYDVDPKDLAAKHIAQQTGEDIKQVFKTLVLCGDRNGHFVCVIPGCDEVDLKKAARISDNKKVYLIPMKELLPTTGYIRGGCSPIGMKKQFKTYIHNSCQSFSYIFVSAGVRGLQIKINPNDLIAFISATIADITVTSSK